MKHGFLHRIVLAQSPLVILVLIVGLYASNTLNWLIQLHSDILATDSVYINEARNLLKTFLSEVRSAEKSLISSDQAFYSLFSQGKSDFAVALASISMLADTQHEQEVIEEIQKLHEQYAQTIDRELTSSNPVEIDRAEISEAIIGRLNELVRFREETISSKTAQARERVTMAVRFFVTIAFCGIAIATGLAWVMARGAREPLRRLASEMSSPGKSKVPQRLNLKAPKEVAELVEAFEEMREAHARFELFKTDFIAHFSQELKPPLASIREGTDLLMEGAVEPLTEAQRGILEVLRIHTDRLSQAISSILDFFRMETDTMVYDFKPCDLIPIIHRSVETVAVAAKNARLELKTDLPILLPPVFIDSERIFQVLTNVLNNAIRFTPPGGKIRIRAHLEKNSINLSDQIAVKVSSSGDIVLDEDPEKISYDSPQSTGDTRSKRRGTGLAFAICRYIVAAHQGTMWVENNEGGGTTFAFTLPVLYQA